MPTSTKTATHPFAKTRKTFKTASGREGQLYSLPALAKTYPNISRLPVSIRIVLESVLRNCDGKKVSPEHVAQLANWQPNGARIDEIPFVVSRVVLQDFTGVPLLVDLAAMRSKFSSMPAMNSVAAMPSTNIDATKPSNCTSASPWGPMAMPSSTSKTTTGTRTPIGTSASNGASTAAVMIQSTG
jgi:hypothetical protein